MVEVRIQNFITLGQSLLGVREVAEDMLRELARVCCVGCRGYVAWVAEDMLQFLGKQIPFPGLALDGSLTKFPGLALDESLTISIVLNKKLFNRICFLDPNYTSTFPVV